MLGACVLKMHFTAHTQLIAPVALAAMHGTTDFAKPIHRLLPYSAILYWPECLPVTPIFLCASMIHFGRDVGGLASFSMHTLFVLGAILGLEDAVFHAFAAYFCLVHTPIHYVRHRSSWRYPLVATLICALAVAMHQPLPEEIVLTDWMQRLIVAHIVCDELETI